jgi:hypothetical protein
MTTLSPAFERRLAAAAALRAAGSSWEAVAERLGRSPAACRRWPVRYRAHWDYLYAVAEDRLAAELRAESQAVLRVQLRLDDTKEKRDAAKGLLAATRRSRTAAPPPPPADPLLSLVEHLTHDQAVDLAFTCDRALASGDAD